MELMKYKKNQRSEWVRQAIYLSILSAVLLGVSFWYDGQIKTMADELSIVEQKSRLVSNLHREMLAVSNMQFRLLHASDYNEAHELLLMMAENVSSYVTDLHQFEQMAKDDDIELLNKFRSNAKQWRAMTNEISSYAYLVSNTDLINVLSALQLNLHRLDDESPALLVAKHDKQ